MVFALAGDSTITSARATGVMTPFGGGQHSTAPAGGQQPPGPPNRTAPPAGGRPRTGPPRPGRPGEWAPDLQAKKALLSRPRSGPGPLWGGLPQERRGPPRRTSAPAPPGRPPPLAPAVPPAGSAYGSPPIGG